MKYMRSIMLAAAVLSVFAGSVRAEELTDADYQDLDKLHTKIVKMKKQMDRLVKDIVSTYSDDAALLPGGFGQDVRVDIVEDAKQVTVRADLPGMDKDKIDITLEQGRFLKIAGSRDVAKQETAPGVVKQERMSGRFERVVALPVECMPSGITATYKSGVLEVAIPKKEPVTEPPVKIKVAG